MKTSIHPFLASLAAGMMLTLTVAAQSISKEINFNAEESLSLEAIIKQVVATHPTILKAAEAVQIADAGVGMAKTGKLPDIDFTAGYTRLGPLSSITIPDMGTFQMGVADNFNTSLNVRQSIYDFSKTDKSIKLQESSKEMATQAVELVKQRLSLATALNYYSLVYLQEALKIKNQQIETLKEHLNFVNKKMETGSALKYDVLSTQVRLSAAENQKVDIVTAYRNSLSSLNSLLGLPVETILKVKKSTPASYAAEPAQQMIEYAVANRPEMTLANLKQENAKLSLASTKVQSAPSLSAFTTGGFKNGYIPESQKIKANYTAGLTLKVPIFTANRQKYNEAIAVSNISVAQQEQIQAQRDISAEVFQNDANLQSAKQKIEQSKKQVQQAEESRKLAELSYQTGSLTNLDLLDATTLEAESRLNLLKAQAEFATDLIKLELSLGKTLYE